jgi:hypothetical protein
MVLTSASPRQRQRYLDGPHLALDHQLVERVPELAEHVGRPACILTDSRRTRIALLLGVDMVATIEVDTSDAEAWLARAPALGGRSAGCLDLNSLLTSHYKPLPALFELESPSAAPEALAEEAISQSESANPFSVSNKEKRKLARIQSARDKSEAAAQKLRQLEAAAASTTQHSSYCTWLFIRQRARQRQIETEAMSTIARGIVAARIARAGRPTPTEDDDDDVWDLELELCWARRLRTVEVLYPYTREPSPTNICQMDFVNKPRLTGELDEVPGLGEVGINTLNRSGIKTTYQVIGKFLEVRKGGSNRA